MHSKLVLLAVLSAGLVPVTLMAQDAATPAPAASAPAAVPAAPSAAVPPAAAAHAAPQAYPAKIALVAFQPAVVETNEGKAAVAKVQAKFQPKQQELVSLNGEIEKLKKELQGAPTSTTEAERTAKMKSLDSKEKQMQERTESARTAYQSELQEALSKVAEKVHKTLISYVQTNGYTILFDVSNEQSAVMWAQLSPSADITQAVIDAYNTESGVAAPAAGAAAPAGSAARPKAGTASHPAAKPATK